MKLGSVFACVTASSTNFVVGDPITKHRNRRIAKANVSCALFGRIKSLSNLAAVVIILDIYPHKTSSYL